MTTLEGPPQACGLLQYNQKPTRLFSPVSQEGDGEVDFTMNQLIPFDSGWVWFQFWFPDILLYNLPT